LKVLKWLSEAVNRRRIDNKMKEEKRTNYYLQNIYYFWLPIWIFFL